MDDGRPLRLDDRGERGTDSEKGKVTSPRKGEAWKGERTDGRKKRKGVLTRDLWW